MSDAVKIEQSVGLTRYAPEIRALVALFEAHLALTQRLEEVLGRHAMARSSGT